MVNRPSDIPLEKTFSLFWKVSFARSFLARGGTLSLCPLLSARISSILNLVLCVSSSVYQLCYVWKTFPEEGTGSHYRWL